MTQGGAKKTVFSVAAVALPLLVILLLELGFRIAGIGKARRDPFQPVPGRESYVALDPEFGGMFFRGFQPGVAFDPMIAEKPDKTVRIVALGGSTTAGFPYHWYYGFPARLEDRLAASLPGVRVEVANLGMTATNSYTLRVLAKEAVDLQPEAVVIYAGHNEFYGAFGTGGNQGWTSAPVFVKRMVIEASRWGLVTAISSLFEPDELPAGQRRTLMARVVENASIDKESPAYRDGIKQYASNLEDALRTLDDAGIPVFLGTLTSNLADQPPLGNEADAQAAYDRGRELLAIGDTAGARTAFLEAKEADGIRFRAPEQLNDVIRQLAAKLPRVTLVDVGARFEDESPGGLEGSSLFSDHLHPNARGYALMADAFFESMSTHPGVADLALPTDPAPASIDPIEASYATVQVSILTNGYPFRKDRTPAESEAAARSVVEEMAESDHYAERLTSKMYLEGMTTANALNSAVGYADEDRDTLSVLQFYKALLYWQPFNEGLIEKAVSYALQNPAFDRSTALLARFAAIHTGSPFSLNAEAAVALRQRQLARADRLLEAVEERDPDSKEMLYNRARLLLIQGDTTQARDYFERYKSVSRQP